MVVASKCPEDESGNFLEVLEEVLYYFLLCLQGRRNHLKIGGGLKDPTDLLPRFGADKVIWISKLDAAIVKLLQPFLVLSKSLKENIEDILGGNN